MQYMIEAMFSSWRWSAGEASHSGRCWNEAAYLGSLEVIQERHVPLMTAPSLVVDPQGDAQEGHGKDLDPCEYGRAQLLQEPLHIPGWHCLQIVRPQSLKHHGLPRRTIRPVDLLENHHPRNQPQDQHHGHQNHACRNNVD
jgi:hypothetical protein